MEVVIVDGNIEYTSNLNFNGSDELNYIVNDEILALNLHK